jgi:hypothetical protein
MTANMLRLRHQFTLAEAKCSEVLKLDPDNSAACSVMGDILRDQGREEDALEWYKMAVDRNPTNEADRKKLEALIDRRFSARPERRQPPLAVIKQWAKATRAEVGAARPICPWAMVTAAIFAITLLAAFTLVLVGKRTPPSSAFSTPGNRDPFLPQANLVSAPTPRPPSPGPAEITGDIAALEQSLLDQLHRKAAELNPNCRVTVVRIDPKQATAELEFSLPAYWSPVSARKEITRMAAALAPVAAAADARFAAVNLRCYARQSAGPDQLVLIANGDAAALRAQGEGKPPDNPEAMFRTMWWSQTIAPENDAGAFNPPLPGGGATAPRGP